MNIKQYVFLLVISLSCFASSNALILVNQTQHPISITIPSCANLLPSREHTCPCGGYCNCETIDADMQLHAFFPTDPIERFFSVGEEQGISIEDYSTNERLFKTATIQLAEGCGVELPLCKFFYINIDYGRRQLGKQSFFVYANKLPQNETYHVYAHIKQPMPQESQQTLKVWIAAVSTIPAFIYNPGKSLNSDRAYTLSLQLLAGSGTAEYETNSKQIRAEGIRNGFRQPDNYQKILENPSEVFAYVSKSYNEPINKTLLTITTQERTIHIPENSLEAMLLAYIRNFYIKQRIYKADHVYHTFPAEILFSHLAQARIVQIIRYNQFGFPVPEEYLEADDFYGMYLVLEWDGAWYNLIENKICRLHPDFGINGKTGRYQIGIAFGKQGRSFYPYPYVVHRCFLPEKRRDNSCIHDPGLEADYLQDLFPKLDLL